MMNDLVVGELTRLAAARAHVLDHFGLSIGSNKVRRSRRPKRLSRVSKVIAVIQWVTQGMIRLMLRRKTQRACPSHGRRSEP